MVPAMANLNPNSAEEVEAAARELVAKLAEGIAAEEARFMDRKLFLEQRIQDPDELEDQLRTAWDRFKSTIYPMQRQREYLIKELSFLSLMKPVALTIPLSSDIAI